MVFDCDTTWEFHITVSPYADISFCICGLRVEPNPGLGGVRDVASTIISHAQTMVNNRYMVDYGRNNYDQK